MAKAKKRTKKQPEPVVEQQTEEQQTEEQQTEPLLGDGQPLLWWNSTADLFVPDPKQDTTINVVGGLQGAVTDYDEWVAEAKCCIRAIEDYEKKLGELADRVETKYDEEKLAEFARDIGVELTSVLRWRSMYRSYKDAPKEILKETSPGVLQALQAHPGRNEIIKEKPDLTVREARTYMRDYKLAHPSKSEAKDEHWKVKLTRNWCNELTAFAQGGARYRHIAPEHLDPIVLQQVRVDDDDWEHMLAIWRNCATILNTAADELDQARSRAPKPPMFDDPPGDATPTPDSTTPDPETPDPAA